MEFTCLHRKNRKRFATLPALYAAYRQETVCNHGGKKHGLYVFKAELKRVLKRTDECVWTSNPRCFIVLHEGDTVLGFADIRVVSDDLNEPLYGIPAPVPGVPPLQLKTDDMKYGTVEDFCIVPDARHKGYGKKLYERVEAVMKKNSTHTVCLTPDPKTGVVFWEKMGYADTGILLPDTQSHIFRKHI